MKLTDNTVGLVCSPYLEARLVRRVKAGEKSMAVQHRCSLPFFVSRFLFPSSPPLPVPNLCFSAVDKGFADRGIIAKQSG